ncbi:rap1 GTPase-GDP dissociation stimulator 1-A [Brienomyrus brachyistius]|uniref:rap1 GTPase-GDP dissociation stimulator 1-A n=1 Tax=Brienomyrus brachyistius TaxID=42636 RepID=UPI0020B2D349|nr:rap1 GTPase-GDP dissociation stimulator 1-A [Brienomyrus brachyistius]
MGSFTEAVEAISVSTELVVEELSPHLDILLTTLQDGTEGAAEWIAASGILCTLAQMLRTRGPLTLHAAQLVADLSGHASVREHCIKAGLGPTLLGLLACGDQELLLHVIRALGRICLGDYVQQDLLVRGGALPLLMETMQTLPEYPLLVPACLQALCSLAGMGEDEGLVMNWNRVGSLGGDECVYWGMPCSPHGLLSMVTVVRVNQGLWGHHSVAVEKLQRCSSTVWSSQASRGPPSRSSFIPRGVCSRSGRVMEHGVRNNPRFSSLRSRVFHTLL